MCPISRRRLASQTDEVMGTCLWDWTRRSTGRWDLTRRGTAAAAANVCPLLSRAQPASGQCNATIGDAITPRRHWLVVVGRCRQGPLMVLMGCTGDEADPADGADGMYR